MYGRHLEREEAVGRDEIGRCKLEMRVDVVRATEQAPRIPCVLVSAFGTFGQRVGDEKTGRLFRGEPTIGT
jgi:hypothetical protein